MRTSILLVLMLTSFTLFVEAYHHHGGRRDSAAVYSGSPRDSSRAVRLITAPRYVLPRIHRPRMTGYHPRRLMFPSAAQHMANFRPHFMPSMPAFRMPMYTNVAQSMAQMHQNMMNEMRNFPFTPRQIRQQMQGMKHRIESFACPWNMVRSSQLNRLMERVLLDYDSETPYTLISIPRATVSYCERCSSRGCTPDRHEVHAIYVIAQTDGCAWTEKCNCTAPSDTTRSHCQASGTIPYGVSQITNLKITCDGIVLTREETTSTEVIGEDEDNDDEDTVASEDEAVPEEDGQEEEVTVSFPEETTTTTPEPEIIGSGDVDVIALPENESNEEKKINGEEEFFVEKTPPPLPLIENVEKKVLNL
ncbi:uncharacterized protein LOC143448767 [Clavelina lepadiformis]|uniref:uncharacterized protein LOC143448767 n=1 Tax=Clavelina lepadiformis TaxID=159417 RepID=UPI0040427A0E